jgi:hypothetical protein
MGKAMRWTKVLGLVVLGSVLGGLLAGYVVFEYMERFGVAWNQWASTQSDRGKAGDALGTVTALAKLQAGRVDETRNILEWRLTSNIAELASMRRAGRDPDGLTSKALSRISDYRHNNPWASGNPEVDQLTSDALNGLTGSPQGR